MFLIESYISQLKNKTISVSVYDLETEKEININTDIIGSSSAEYLENVPANIDAVKHKIIGMAFQTSAVGLSYT